MILDKKLQIFLAVAETGSFSQASKKFSLSQSVISFHIDTLEGELGVKLFERHGRMISLTPDGEYLFKEAKKLALAARQLEDNFSEHSAVIARSLRLAGCSLTCAFTLPWTLSDFHKLHPDVLFVFKTLSQDEMIEQIFNEEIDFGFVGYPVQNRKLNSLECYPDEIILVSNPEAFPDQMPLRELSNHPLFWINTDSGLDLLIRKELPEAGMLIKKLKIYLEVEDLSVLKSFVRTGMGMAFLPKVTVMDELNAGLLKEVKVEGLKLERTTCMLYRKRKEQREIMADFLKFMENRSWVGILDA
jgi:DNA-binding transcriptional LysR family regulator